MDFNQAWTKARKGQQSGLFAAEYTYGYPKPTQRRKTSSSQLTPQQKSYQQRTYHPTPAPVWSEYSGHSAHRTPGYSPIQMEQISAHARKIFSAAEYQLSRMKEKW